MKNESKLNTILLVIIIILLIIGFGYFFLNNLKKDDNGQKQSPLPEMPQPIPAPQPIPTKESTPISKTTPTSKPCETTSGTSLDAKYNNLKCQYSLKYETFSIASNIFKTVTDSHMKVDRIDFYVPGKLPREDGNPYFIGNGTVNKAKNDCVVGYMNLVTGIYESHHDVCIIYN